MRNDRIKTGIAGLGRSGWNIHARALEALGDLYQVTAVADPDEGRRLEATQRFGCRAFATYEDMLASREAEMIVVATPNALHAQNAMQAVRAGHHVICEKPLAAASDQVDQMLQAAREEKRHLIPFQNRRYEALFLKIREVIDSGILGRIVQINLAVHAFARRWDWQTLREFNGGQLNNTGPHFLDQLLQLCPDGPLDVFCRMDRAIASGDAEDHVKILMQVPGGPIVDLEISSACAFPQPLWRISGTAGGLVSTSEGLQWKSVDLNALPDRPVVRESDPGRTYNSEKLDWITETWSPPATASIPETHKALYRDVFDVLRKGKPQPITAESVRRQIEVIERCHRNAVLVPR